MMIQYTLSGILRFIQRNNGNTSPNSSNLNYLDTKFNARESNISCDPKAVSTELHKKFNSYIKAASEDNNFKNARPDQTLKQIHLFELTLLKNCGFGHIY